MRRSGISAWVGKNGSGKTLAMMEDLVLPALAKGVPVVSTMTVFASADDAVCPGAGCACRSFDDGGDGTKHYRVRRLHPLWRPLESWRSILHLEGCVLALDEISSAFGARESAKMPFQVAARLQQLRKHRVRVGWTAPSWKRADVVLREVSTTVTECRGRFGKVNRDAGGDEWVENRLFRFSTFDCGDFEEFSLQDATAQRRGGKRSLKPLDARWYWRTRHEAHLLYDTHEPVQLLDHLDEYGTCVECGGSRRRPTCRCDVRNDSARRTAAGRPPGAPDGRHTHMTDAGEADAIQQGWLDDGLDVPTERGDRPAE